MANGDVMRETFLSLTLEPGIPNWLALAYLFSFICLFMYVVLKVILAMIEEALAHQSLLAIRDEDRERRARQAQNAAKVAQRTTLMHL